LLLLLLPGCALFGDPIIGTWSLVEVEEYGPLTSTSVEDQVTTTTTLAGKMVLDTIDGSTITGTYTESIQVDVVGPTQNSSDTTRTREDAEARDSARDEYDVDIDGFGDWICLLDGTELDCEDDDGNEVLFERVADEKK
jgi:hypothetical protein